MKKRTRENSNVRTQAKNGNKRPESASVNNRQGDLSRGPTVEDGIRKEIMFHERNARRNWQKRYGYLSGEVFQQILAEECAEAGLPEDSFMKKPPEDPTKHSPIPLKSYERVPKTSSALIGWRSAQRECDLEFTGLMYVSAKRTIEPPFEPGVFRVTKQRFIFLG